MHRQPVGQDGGRRAKRRCRDGRPAQCVRGRKRHIVTDTLGLLLAVVVTAANCDDGETAPRVLAGLDADRFPRLAVVWADKKYRNNNLDAWLAGQTRLRVEVTTKPDGQVGFQPLKKRWVVEQTFGCLVRSRRLTRDYERLAETSAAMVKLSGIQRMARRARPPRGKRKFRYKRPTAA